MIIFKTNLTVVLCCIFLATSQLLYNQPKLQLKSVKHAPQIPNIHNWQTRTNSKNGQKTKSSTVVIIIIITSNVIDIKAVDWLI